MATKSKTSTIKPIQIQYADWGDFIQIAKPEWKRLLKALGLEETKPRTSKRRNTKGN